MLRDIRELTGEQAAYAAGLRRRSGGLLSDRYIGRTSASMDVGPADDTVRRGRRMGYSRSRIVGDRAVTAGSHVFRVEG